MSTPQEEAAQEAINKDDQSAISKLMEPIPDDGHAPEPPQPAETETEQPAESDGGTDSASVGSVQAPEASESSAAATGDVPQDDYEREIEAYEAPKGASTRTTEVLKILKQKNREEHRARKEREATIAELQKRELLDDAVKNELRDLRTIRDTLAVEHSPAFREHDARIAQYDQEAISLLQQWKLPEETAKYIKDNGGLLKFQASDQLMPPGVQVEGQPATQAQWWAKVVKPMLSDAQKDELADHLSDARRAAREKNQALHKAKSNPGEFFAKQQEAVDKQAKEFQERADKQLSLETDIYGEIAKPKDIPANATAEQKAEIAKHNATLESAKGAAIRWMNDHTAEAEVSKALAITYRDLVIPQVKEIRAENKALRDENAALKQKWEDMRKSKETSRQQSTVQPQKPREEPEKYDAETSIRKLMEAIPA